MYYVHSSLALFQSLGFVLQLSALLTPEYKNRFLRKCVRGTWSYAFSTRRGVEITFKLAHNFIELLDAQEIQSATSDYDINSTVSNQIGEE